MTYATYDDYCAAQEGPEPTHAECPLCAGLDECPADCPVCGGTGEVDLRAERARVRAEYDRKQAEHERAHFLRVCELLGIDPEADEG